MLFGCACARGCACKCAHTICMVLVFAVVVRHTHACVYIQMYTIAKLILTFGWKWQRRISKTAKLRGMKRDNDLKLKIRHILWFQKVIRFFCALIVCCVKQFSNSSSGIHTQHTVEKKSSENKLYERSTVYVCLYECKIRMRVGWFFFAAILLG